MRDLLLREGEGREEEETGGEGRGGEARGRSTCLPPRFGNPGYGPAYSYIAESNFTYQLHVLEASIISVTLSISVSVILSTILIVNIVNDDDRIRVFDVFL